MVERQEETIGLVALPVGTHVVTRVAREGVPAGAAGVVAEEPPSPEGPYRVDFAGGVSATYRHDEIAIRRRQIRDELETRRPGFAELEPFVVYEATVGSRAYGLAREASDVDVRGVYLPPADLHWSLAGVPEQIEDPEVDRVYWELEKFLRLALQSNPNILELLWSPLLGRVDEVGERLRAERRIFLSRHAYATYGAYAISQFKKMERDLRTHGEVRFKHAMHCIRLLIAGARLLDEGEVMVDCSDHRDDLLAVRDGRLAWEEIVAWRRELERELAAAYSRSSLPARPDYSRADDLLVDARRSRI
jgi:predicted nucleotidyltransferase